MLAVPSLEADEVIYIMFSTPLIWSSNGAITEFKTAVELAPVYEARTDTVGGAMSGYWVIGKVVRPMIPKMTIKIEITVERTGLLIYVSSFIDSSESN